MKSVHFLAGHCSGFVSRKKQMFTKSKLHESKISLKRLKRRQYSVKQSGEMKILFSQIQEEQPKLVFDDEDLISNPDEFVSMMSPNPVKTDLNIKASDFRSRGKQKKVPTPPKKFKVNKVTWGSPVVAQKEKKKVGRKPKNRENIQQEAEVKIPKNRGRKPKKKPEDSSQGPDAVPE